MAIVQFLLAVLSIETLFITVLSISQQKSTERQFLELNTEKLRDFWQIITIRGLIKAHAKQTLGALPPVERVVYELCVRNADTIVALAKCATRVFDARDNARQQARLTSNYKLPAMNTELQKANSSFAKNATRLFDVSDNAKRNYRPRSKYKQPAMNTEIYKANSSLAKNATRLFDVSDNAKRQHRPRSKHKQPAMNTEIHEANSSLAKNATRLFNVSDNAKRQHRPRSKHKQPAMNTELRKANSSLAKNKASSIMDHGDIKIRARLGNLTRRNSAAERKSDKVVFKNVRTGKEVTRKFPIKLARVARAELGIDSHAPKLENTAAAAMEEVLDIVNAYASLITKIKPDVEEVRYVKLPIVEELSLKNKKWMRAQASFNEEQKVDYKEKGYAFLNDEQMDLIYNRQEQLVYGMNVTELGSLTKEQKVERIERDIRALAVLDQPRWPAWGLRNEGRPARHRWRRQAESEAVPASEEAGTEEESGIVFRTLSPIVFTSLIGTGAALEVVTLSPQVFMAEVLFPRALVVKILSPRVFLAAILSPNALIARIMSPTSFRVEVLSPRAMHTWVLSPEALVSPICTLLFVFNKGSQHIKTTKRSALRVNKNI
uniref:ENT domain-containing protein n=1 Tax=Angiostrongylus cantonensis TaxID=6313 RepID=A0A158P717_ANGCA